VASGRRKNAYRVLVDKCSGNRPLGRPRKMMGASYLKGP
jgi:hypothetical protein